MIVLVCAVVAAGSVWPSPAVAAPVSLFGPAALPANPTSTDPLPVELGMKFRSDVSGTVSAVRFYKGTGNTGPHVGALWTSSGSRLASVTFANETPTGWQQADFATPVQVQAGTVYVVSYLAPAGHYGFTQGAFVTGIDSPPLHALANGVAGPNGLFSYSATSTFPTSGYRESNYWVDVVFNPSRPAGPPTATITAPADGSTVSGAAAVRGTATAARGFGRVDVSVDGGTASTVTGTSSWSWTLDTTRLSDGRHTLTATAYDVTGSSGTGSAAIVVSNGSSAGLAVDAHVARQQSSAGNAISSPRFSTKQANELVVAFLATSGPASGGQSTPSVTGGGLSWTLRQRANTQSGDVEIWQAVAPAPLSGVSVTARRAHGPFTGQLVVGSFTGASTTVTGAGAGAGQATGAPAVGLTTTVDRSWVWAVGNDPDGGADRRVGPGQTLDSQLVGTGGTFWVQRQTSVTPAKGTAVIANDVGPTADRWNMAAIEIVPARTSVPGFTLQPIDGGPNFFAAWPNAFPSDPGFFPIGVYPAEQTPAALSAVGINYFLPMRDDQNGRWQPVWHSPGGNDMTHVNAQPGFYAGGTFYKTTDGRVSGSPAWGPQAAFNVDGDEMDGNCHNWFDNLPASITALGRCNQWGELDPASFVAVNNESHRVDPTRPLYVGATGTYLNWLGTPEERRAICLSTDIMSFDDYQVVNGGPVYKVYDSVRKVRDYCNNQRPVYETIEMDHMGGDLANTYPLPAQTVAEAWNVIIAGARGFLYFDMYSTITDPTYSGNGHYPAGAMYTAMKTVDGQIKALAPVINAPFAENYVTQTGQVSVMAKSLNGHFYVFAAAHADGRQDVTFTLAGSPNTSVTVLNESRTIPVTAGHFTDTFGDANAVHIYEVN